jgi:CheY-like chemotaxis protein
LRKAGCEVYVANHGLEALDFLRKTEFWSAVDNDTQMQPIALSVILMDVEMPVMDGLTCTRKIRELQSTGHIIEHIPIIAVSANARSEQVARAKEAGIDDAISKPFRIPELLPKIEALLRGGEPALVTTPVTGLA